MSQTRFTMQLPDDLHEIAQECIRRERYRSLPELFASFLRHWALSQQPHAITGEWAALTPEERDRIDAALLRLVRSGKGVRGSAMKAAIYDAIKEVNGKEAKSPRIEEVMDAMPEVIRRALNGGRKA